jgi:hypothetical protein
MSCSLCVRFCSNLLLQREWLLFHFLAILFIYSDKVVSERKRAKETAKAVIWPEANLFPDWPSGLHFASFNLSILMLLSNDFICAKSAFAMEHKQRVRQQIPCIINE